MTKNMISELQVHVHVQFSMHVEPHLMWHAGLFQIMAPYFGAADLHVKKPSAWPVRSRTG